MQRYYEKKKGFKVKKMSKEKAILPDEAITKAYDEVLDKEKKFVSLEEWRAKPYENKDEVCPICEDDYENREGKCYCNATDFPPCGWCETGMPECTHTNGEVADDLELKEYQAERNQ